MWLPEAKHGVEPVCLERLGQPRAGRLLQVLRGVGSLRDRHEERKVAVESTEQSCRGGQKHSRKHSSMLQTGLLSPGTSRTNG